MFACSMFQTGKSLIAFTFDPVTFQISNRLLITLPNSQTGTHNYAAILNQFATWLNINVHAQNRKFYYDGPLFSGTPNYYLVNGKRTHVNDLNQDTKHYISMISTYQQAHSLPIHYRDTYIKKVRTHVASAKPAMECLLMTTDTNEVRMAFALMRDYFHQKSGLVNPPSYALTLQKIQDQPELLIVNDFISFVLPLSQRKRIGFKTLKKACIKWNATKGDIVRRKTDLINSNPIVHHQYQALYLAVL